MNIIDKKSHNELINILNELITTIELMRTEKKDYLLNQNQEEAKEWLKFLCEHTDKEELKTLEDEIANRFVFKFDVEIDTGELDGRRVSLMKEYLIKSNEFLKYLANEGEGIYPATLNEHFNGWHTEDCKWRIFDILFEKYEPTRSC